MNLLHDYATMESFKYSPAGIELAAALKDAIIKLSKVKLTGRGENRVSRRDFDEVDIPGIIKKHTNAIMNVSLVPGFEACIYPADINKNNIFYNSLERMHYRSQEANRIILENDTFDGYVDLQNYKVGGAFKHCFADMIIGDKLVGPKSMFSPEETVAIILHEIGHQFIAMLVSARATRTSLVMLEGTKRLLAAETKVERIRLLRDIEAIYECGIPDIERYAEIKQHPENYKVTILQMAATQSISQVGENIYDARAFEQMADQFAARAGYAIHLSTALDKIYRMTGDMAYNGPVLQLIFSICKMILFVFAGVISISLIVPILFSNPLNQTYDKPLRRIEKLKEEIQGELRNKDLTDTQKKRMLEELKIIDGVTSEMRDNEGVYEYIWSRVFPWGRKQKAIADMHIELERLLNNPMYRASAALSIL